MNLAGRRIHVAGSTATNADEGKLRYAHQIVAELTSMLLREGATFVLPFGKEPLLQEQSGLPPVIFDWTIAETISNALDGKLVNPSSNSGRIIATIATTKTDDHIPEARRQIYDNLRAKEAIDVRFLRAGWTAGALQRQKLAELGDVLIALSGGQGIEHLAVEYSSKGKPVIPLDLQLGASSRDGSGGAARLFDRALENPEGFFRVNDKSSAADLLDKTRTRDGKTEANVVVAALIDLLRQLTPPRAFYVRVLNKSLADYAPVEAFFRTTVDALVAELGYDRCEMGLGDNEFAWMNEAIFQCLHHSGVVVVDITGLRPNCFVELGYALGNHQKVILTAREGTKFPFDVFALEAFLWQDGDDPSTRLDRFRKHWQRNINMPRLVRPNEAR